MTRGELQLGLQLRDARVVNLLRLVLVDGAFQVLLEELLAQGAHTQVRHVLRELGSVLELGGLGGVGEELVVDEVFDECAPFDFRLQLGELLADLALGELQVAFGDVLAVDRGDDRFVRRSLRKSGSAMRRECGCGDESEACKGAHIRNNSIHA